MRAKSKKEDMEGEEGEGGDRTSSHSNNQRMEDLSDSSDGKTSSMIMRSVKKPLHRVLRRDKCSTHTQQRASAYARGEKESGDDRFTHAGQQSIQEGDESGGADSESPSRRDDEGDSAGR